MEFNAMGIELIEDVLKTILVVAIVGAVAVGTGFGFLLHSLIT